MRRGTSAGFMARIGLAVVIAASLACGPLAAQTPAAPSPAPSVSAVAGLLNLSAVIGNETAPIRQGIKWRIFSAEGSDPTLVSQSDNAAPSFSLPPGDYIVHVSYGLASGTKRVSVGRTPVAERVSISAGGLVVNAAIGDLPIAPAKISLAIYIPSPGNSEDKLVTTSLRPGELLRLPEGTYHVVSTYGDSNSIMRADIVVRAGKVTMATMLHKAATLTLKLVQREGAEAMADTAWTVLTPGGDVIREAIGAFPTVTLAEGDYIAIARHDGVVYQGEFKVRSGLDRDVEVVAKRPETR